MAKRSEALPANVHRVLRHLLDYGVYRTWISGLNLTANALKRRVFATDDGAVIRGVALIGYWIVSAIYWLSQGYLVAPNRDSISMFDVLSRQWVCVPNVWQLHHGSRENRRRQAGAYTQYLDIEPGDTVVDVGAYLGFFSLYAAETASQVLAVDPFAAIDGCLERNVAGVDGVTVHPVAAWNRDEPLTLQLSRFPSDTSLIDPDVFPTGQEVDVPGRTVASLCAEADIDTVDFLKIEAEGVEPEVLEGALELRPRKVVVNCGPERHGEAPTETIIEIFSEHGYEIRTVVTDESFAPEYGESPGLSDIEMVFANR